jgi:molybdopterin-guanine dinucleotide biosynthesis protein B
MKIPILGVVGWSGSGKTTLLEYLIRALTSDGKTVNVIKHSHHDVTLEPAHKDSARFRAAGANEVLLASPFRYAIVKELHAQTEPRLNELLMHLAPADLTLVEGYKWAKIRKLEIYRPSLGKPPIFTEDEFIIAVASDEAKPPNCPDRLVWLDLNQPAKILCWLTNSLQNDIFARETVEIY